MKVRIGIRTFPIRQAAPGDLDEGEYGVFKHDRGIGLAPGWTPDVTAATIVHEIIHALWDMYALPETVDEETACQKLEAPLLAFLCDNPTLIAQLRAAVRKGRPLEIPESAT